MSITALPMPPEQDIKRLESYDAGVRVRALIEMAIVRKMVTDILAAGYLITVDDGDDAEAVKDSTDIEAIMDAAFAVDECWVQVFAPRHPGSGTFDLLGTVFLVFGNDGWDVICDYHTSLREVLKGANEYADQLQGWC